MRVLIILMACMLSTYSYATYTTPPELKLEKQGDWTFQLIEETDIDWPICTISNVQSYGDIIRYVGIKYVMALSGNYYFLHIAKNTWNIPKDTNIPLTIGFMSETLEITAKGDKDHVEKYFTHKEGQAFLDLFYKNGIMGIKFPGSEPDWIYSLNLTINLRRKMTMCINTLDEYRKLNLTQPF